MHWLMNNWYFPTGFLALAVLVVVVKWHDIHQRVGIWGYVGTALGWFFIGVGLLGGLLPLLPGFPAGILGLLLLGPNDPVVRRLWLWLHRFARWCADSSFPRRQRLGHWLLEHELRVARRVYKEGHVSPWQEPDEELREEAREEAREVERARELEAEIEAIRARDDQRSSGTGGGSGNG
jgi:hypothetical protein